MSKLVPIRREKAKPLRRRKKITPLGRVIVVISVIILVFMTVKLAKVVTLFMAGSVAAVEGSVEMSWSGEALVVRSEEAYVSETPGWLQPVAAEGGKVRAGALICNITDDEGRVVQAMTAARSGVVSYRLDGLEDIAPGARPEAVWAAYRNLGGKLRQAGDKVAAGDRIYKLIDNYSFSVYTSLEGSQELLAGQDARVNLPDGELIMDIRQVEQVGDRLFVQFSSDVYRTATTEWRYLKNVDVARARRYGLVIPASSIVQSEQGNTGVYLLIAGRPYFKRVEVAAISQKEAAVTGIPVGAQVIPRPGLLWLSRHGW